MLYMHKVLYLSDPGSYWWQAWARLGGEHLYLDLETMLRSMALASTFETKISVKLSST